MSLLCVAASSSDIAVVWRLQTVVGKGVAKDLFEPDVGLSEFLVHFAVVASVGLFGTLCFLDAPDSCPFWISCSFKISFQCSLASGYECRELSEINKEDRDKGASIIDCRCEHQIRELR